MESKRKILITGGGSGGHVSAAYALINALKEKNEIIYVGGDLGMVGERYGNSTEQKRFKDADFRCEYIRAGKLQRKLSFNTIKLLFRTILGFFDALKIVKNEKPSLIFSTGGYVSVPVCIAGWLKKTPIYLHEQTTTVGLANRIAGKFAKKIFVAFESSRKYFKGKEVVHTGNIVRESVFKKEGSGDVVNALRKMLENDLPIIYISGGGLGSHILNETVFSNLRLILPVFQIILQTGDNQIFNDYAKAISLKNSLPEEIQDHFFPTKFVNDKEIGFLFSNIDMFVGRSGANTVYEIGLLKIPSIFVPIPWVTNNEQEKNAQVLVDLGLSKILKEGELKQTNLLDYLNDWLHTNRKIDITALEKQFPKNAVELIVENL